MLLLGMCRIMYMPPFLLLRKKSSSDLVTHTCMVLKTITSVLSRLTTNLYLYKMPLKHFDFFVIPLKSRTSTQCQSVFSNLSKLTPAKNTPNLPISLCNQIAHLYKDQREWVTVSIHVLLQSCQPQPPTTQQECCLTLVHIVLISPFHIYREGL